MAEEFWRWEEGRWEAPGIDWRKARVVTGGVDVGSVSSQAVVMVDGQLYCYANIRTGYSSPGSAVKAMRLAMEGTGLDFDKLHYTVATGYGRVNVEFAHKTVTEIACHALGARFIYGPSVRTVLDMGGQDCKVIRCDDSGRVVDFVLNDKCAAGTGRGLEIFAQLLQVPLERLGRMSLELQEDPPAVANTCVVFARSEAAALLRQGWSRQMVAAAYCGAMAKRVARLVMRIGLEEDFAITGGIAKNEGIVRRIEKELGVRALEPSVDTQLAGAIGAALFAYRECGGQEKS